jgi:putative transcriptional regulator
LAVSSGRREARSWSEDILAERVEVSKNHIGYIEPGEREPSLEVAVRIARVLGLSLDQIFLDARRELEAEHAPAGCLSRRPKARTADRNLVGRGSS